SGMTIVIVVAFEVVDIHHHQGQRLSLTLGLAPAALGALTESTPIEQPGKEVLLRQVLQQPLGKKVLPAGVFEEIATKTADQVGTGKKYRVVQQLFSGQRADHLDQQIGEEGYPATQRRSEEA